jgi:hypothetical protein
MTLRQVPDNSIKEIALDCACGAIVHIQVGERVTCRCRREYYCDLSLHVWENVLRTSWTRQQPTARFSQSSSSGWF